MTTEFLEKARLYRFAEPTIEADMSTIEKAELLERRERIDSVLDQLQEILDDEESYLETLESIYEGSTDGELLVEDIEAIRQAMECLKSARQLA